HHIPEPERPAAFGEMYRVMRPGGRLLVADFRPSGIWRLLHPVGHAMRHNNVDLLDDLAAAAGFYIESRGDVPMMRYVLATRPART
ncbi:MAG TPA: hypothetical protein VGJ54_16130, partial [Streptosporangiaceae bacterium]